MVCSWWGRARWAGLIYPLESSLDAPERGLGRHRNRTNREGTHMRILAFVLLSTTIVFPCICHADSGAPACDTRVYRERALVGDWAQALKVSDSCVAESDVKLKQKQPDLAKDPWGALAVANAAEWRRVSAELHALLGDFTAAESERTEAESLFVSFI